MSVAGPAAFDTGRGRIAVVPSPTSPRLLPPQHRTLPSLASAHVASSPAQTRVIGMHVDAWQTPGHWWPQVPQFDASEVRSAHVVPHMFVGGQTHWPPWQTLPGRKHVAPLSTMPSQSLSRPSQTSGPLRVHEHIVRPPPVDAGAHCHSGAGGQSLRPAHALVQIPTARHTPIEHCTSLVHALPKSAPASLVASALASATTNASSTTSATLASGAPASLLAPLVPHDGTAAMAIASATECFATRALTT
jgi:hypothetical protein